MKTNSFTLLLYTYICCTCLTLTAQVKQSEIKDSPTKLSIILPNEASQETLDQTVQDLKKEGVNLTINRVKRNESGKIIGIALNATSVKGNLQISFNQNSTEPLDDIHIYYDTSPQLKIQTAESKIKSTTTQKTQAIKATDKNHDLHPKKRRKKHKIFINNNPHAKTTIIVNGKKITEEELENMDEDEIQTIEVRSVRKNNHEIKSEPQVRFNSKNNTPHPMYIIDGKEATHIDHLRSDQIDTLIILKDERAIKKYGTKGRHGVIEITTKK